MRPVAALLAIAALLAALSTAQAWAARPGASAPAVVPDVEPPACDDPRALQNLARSYADAALNTPVPPLVRIVQPHQVAMQDRVPMLDSPTMRAEFGGYPWGHSRYCQATLELLGHGTDVAHWRIEVRRTGPQDQFQLTPCFDKWMAKSTHGHIDCSFVSP